MSGPARTVRVVDILGNAEVRRLLGRQLNGTSKEITRHRLIRLRANQGFPAPIRKLDASEIWDRAEVRAWLEQYNERP